MPSSISSSAPSQVPIRVGIIGLGFMAATHIRAYRQLKEVRLVAVCNPSGRNLDGDLSRVAGNIDTGSPVRLDMSAIRAYRDPQALIRDGEVDVVDICTPTASHAPLALAALQAGKHVVCEKPMTCRVEDARRILEAAQSGPGFFLPAMCLRFWPEWAWLKRAVADQSYGRVLSARFRRVAEPPAWGKTNFLNGAESGGALFDLHIHDTDFVLHCFGMPRRVHSSGHSSISGAVDHVVTQYEYPGGPVVYAEGGWTMAPGFGFSMAYTVNFERATVDYDVARGAESLKLFAPEQSPRVVTCEGPDGYVGELGHLIESIREGKPPHIVTAQDGLNAVRICAAEERSVKEGRPVDVAD